MVKLTHIFNRNSCLFDTVLYIYIYMHCMRKYVQNELLCVLCMYNVLYFLLLSLLNPSGTSKVQPSTHRHAQSQGHQCPVARTFLLYSFAFPPLWVYHSNRAHFTLSL